MSQWYSIYRRHGVVDASPEPYVVGKLKLLKDSGVGAVLDLGCGTGRHTKVLVKNGHKVFASDLSANALEILKMELNGISENVQVNRSDMAKIPYPDSSFDAVLAWDVIAHGDLRKISKASNEITRVLRPDGLLIIGTLSKAHPRFSKGQEVEPGTIMNCGDWEYDEWNDIHHFFSEQELRLLFSEFEVLELKEEKRETGYNTGGIHWHMCARRRKP